MQRIPIGIVGLNFGRAIIEEQLLTGAGAPFFRLAAVCRRDRAKADAAAAKYCVPAYYSLDDLLADPAVAAIGLFTGPVGRAEQVRRIIRAGKDVMTTKPFEVDPAAALDVLQEARRLDRVVHMNSPNPVFAADLRQIADWREQHDLGPPVAARCETWCSYRERPDGSWYDDPTQCPTAPIFRLGIYGINDLVPFFAEAQTVQVTHSRIFTQRPTPDNAALTVRFGDGAIATVFASFCIRDGAAYRQTTTINFSNGTVVRRNSVTDDGRDVRLTLHRPPAGDFDPIRSDPVVETASCPAEHCSGMYLWHAFHQAIEDKTADDLTPEQVVAGIRIAVAMGKAERSGATEAVDGR